MPSVPSRLPPLGPRGEGWVAGQLALIAAVGLLGWRDRDLATLRSSGLRRMAAAGGAAAVTVGVTVAVLGARDLGRSLTPMPRPLEEAELVQTGMYRHIRHPLYAAVMLVALGWSAVTASVRAIVVSAVLAAWLDAKARREEAWLVERFPAYSAYRRRTSRFVPRLY